MTRIDDFLKYLQAEKRYAVHTIKAYKNDLNQFHAFCQETDREGMDLHFRVIRSWVVSLMDSGYSSRTVHRKLTSLSTYCSYLIKEGQLDSNPVERVLKPKLNKRVPAFVEEGKMDLLLDEYDFGEGFTGTRNRLVLDMLYQTGMRRSELIGLKTGSINREGKSVKVMGKRGKERIIPVGDELLASVEKYMVVRSEVMADKAGNSLIVTEKGGAAYDKLVYRIVNNYLSMVTTLDKKSPHVLRHTFATHMLNRGADLNAIKELLGHANLSATQVYTHNTYKKLKSIYNQAHPRA
ncbi:MAG: integrase [Bacteroidetes bacterium]|nr:MAG: integrase [Bacteroidota bacterium]RLD94521.1 MAG: integrase [Bacteroidota bacterium]